MRENRYNTSAQPEELPMLSTLNSLPDVDLGVIRAMTVAYGILVAASALTAMCARTRERRRDALAVLRALLLDRSTGRS